MKLFNVSLWLSPTFSQLETLWLGSHTAKTISHLFLKCFFVMKVTHGNSNALLQTQGAKSAVEFVYHFNKFCVHWVFFLSSLFCEVDRIKFLEFINMHLPMLVCFKISILGVDLKHIYMGLCIQILSTVLATALCTEISCRLMNTRKRLIHRV